MNDDETTHSADKDALVLGGIIGGISLFVFWMWQRADDSNISRAEARGEESRWWFVDHPIVAALIVFAVVTIGFRLYCFMRTLEDRTR